MHLDGGILVSNPILKEDEIPNHFINKYIDDALNDADKEHIKGKDITPYLLKHIKEHTNGKSLEANILGKISFFREGSFLIL